MPAGKARKPPTAAAMGESLSAVGAPLFDAQGERLGWVREPEAQPAKATIVVFHGNAGCAHHHGPLADRLAERGWRVVSAEYPGYCGRPGKASVDAILDDAARQLDAARALQADAPLVAGGYSLGAAVAAAAARRREVGGLLLVTPWASFASLAQHHYPFLPARLLARRDLETIEALAQAPRQGEAVVLVGAARDTIIPVQQARQLAERYPAALYLELPEAGHNDWIDCMRAADWDAIVARLER